MKSYPTRHLSAAPNVFQPLIDAINSTTINTSVSIDKEAKKTLYTAVFTLSAALIIAASLNARKRRS